MVNIRHVSLIGDFLACYHHGYEKWAHIGKLKVFKTME
jgi:hypothetical protein